MFSKMFFKDETYFSLGASPKAHPPVDSSNDNMYGDESEGTSRNTGSNNPDLDSVSSEEYNRQKTSGKSNENGDGDRSSFVLPGFILHPSGTHYMPISVQNTNISGLLDDFTEDGGMPVFHPISIPVHFRRPVI